MILSGEIGPSQVLCVQKAGNTEVMDMHRAVFRYVWPVS